MGVGSVEIFFILFPLLHILQHDLVLSERHLVFDLLPDIEGEDRAFAVGALHIELAVHERKEVRDDGHTKARTLYVPVLHHIQPLERLEELIHVFLPDADARIPDFKTDQSLPFASFQFLHIQCDRALAGVLDRVGEEVHDHLVDAGIIAVKLARKMRIHVHAKFQILFARPFRNGVNKVGDQRRRTVTHGDDLHLSVLDLGEIQDAVDEGKKVSSRRADVSRVFHDLLAVRLPHDHFVHAQDRINRRSDLMGHIRQETALRLVCLVRRILLQFQNLRFIFLPLLVNAHFLKFPAVGLLVLCSEVIEEGEQGENEDGNGDADRELRAYLFIEFVIAHLDHDVPLLHHITDEERAVLSVQICFRGPVSGFEHKVQEILSVHF